MTRVYLESPRDQSDPEEQKSQTDSELESLRECLIGSHSKTLIHTPFGQKPFLMANSATNGVSHSLVEDFLRKVILPFGGDSDNL